MTDRPKSRSPRDSKLPRQRRRTPPKHKLEQPTRSEEPSEIATAFFALVMVVLLATWALNTTSPGAAKVGSGAAQLLFGLFFGLP